MSEAEKRGEKTAKQTSFRGTVCLAEARTVCTSFGVKNVQIEKWKVRKGASKSQFEYKVAPFGLLLEAQKWPPR